MGRGVSSKSSSAAVKTVLLRGQEELRLALIVSQVPMGEFGSCLRGSEGSRSVGQLPDRRPTGSYPETGLGEIDW